MKAIKCALFAITLLSQSPAFASDKKMLIDKEVLDQTINRCIGKTEKNNVKAAISSTVTTGAILAGGVLLLTTADDAFFVVGLGSGVLAGSIAATGVVVPGSYGLTSSAFKSVRRFDSLSYKDPDVIMSAFVQLEELASDADSDDDFLAYTTYPELKIVVEEVMNFQREMAKEELRVKLFDEVDAVKMLITLVNANELCDYEKAGLERDMSDVDLMSRDVITE